MRITKDVKNHITGYIDTFPNDYDAIATEVCEIIVACMEAVDDAYFGYDKKLEKSEYDRLYKRVKNFVGYEL